MNVDPKSTLKDCPVIPNEQLADGRHIRIVPESPLGVLTDKQLIDYHEYRTNLLSYLFQMGKNPEKAQGYSAYTIYADNNRMVNFDEWVWDHVGGYKVPPNEDGANAYLETVALKDVSQTTKGKIQEALRRYSVWLQHKFGQDEWEFDWAFDGSETVARTHRTSSQLKSAAASDRPH